MEERNEQVRNFVNTVLTKERYKVAILLVESPLAVSNFARPISQQIKFLYIDITQDLLPHLPEPVGAYDHYNLLRYLLDSANSNDQAGVLVDSIEPLLSTFGKNKAKSFFEAISHVEPRTPIILVTYLREIVNLAHFPQSKIILLS